MQQVFLFFFLIDKNQKQCTQGCFLFRKQDSFLVYLIKEVNYVLEIYFLLLLFSQNCDNLLVSKLDFDLSLFSNSKFKLGQFYQNCVGRTFLLKIEELLESKNYKCI